MRTAAGWFVGIMPALAKQEKAKRQRIKEALKRVESEAQARRIRSASTRVNRSLTKTFEEAISISISNDIETPAQLMAKEKPSTPMPQTPTELAKKRSAKTSIGSLSNQSLGSMPAVLKCPIPQSPMSDFAWSDVTNNHPETSCNLSTCAVVECSDHSLDRTPKRLAREDANGGKTESIEIRVGSAPRMRNVLLENEPSATEKQKQQCPRPVDPRREWELAPLTEALQKFIQSDEIFCRPPTTRFSSSPVHVKENASSFKHKPMLNKHSIISLIEKYKRGNENSCFVNDKLQSETKVQTQTSPSRETKSIAKCISVRPQPPILPSAVEIAGKDNQQICSHGSHENTAHGDTVHNGYGDESFPSYHSKSVATNVTAHTLPHLDQTQRDGSFPSYSESFGLGSNIGARPMTPHVNGHTACVTKEKVNDDKEVCLFLQNNTKGCAWVFNINGDDKSVGNDKNVGHHDTTTRDTDTSPDSRAQAKRPTTSPTTETSSTEEDEYDSSFLSEGD